MRRQPKPKRVVDLPGLCSYLALTEAQARGLVDRHRIPVLKVGGLLRFDLNEIDLWLDNNKRAAS